MRRRQFSILNFQFSIRYYAICILLLSLYKYAAILIRLLQTNPIMKNKILAIILLATTAVAMSSCFASRSKYGCPGNPTVNSRFRG